MVATDLLLDPTDHSFQLSTDHLEEAVMDLLVVLLLVMVVDFGFLLDSIDHAFQLATDHLKAVVMDLLVVLLLVMVVDFGYCRVELTP